MNEHDNEPGFGRIEEPGLSGAQHTGAQYASARYGRGNDGKKSLVRLFLAFCVLVTLGVSLLFTFYPRQLADFFQVLYLVRKDFREPLSISHMLDGAITGLADSAGDKYTYYLTPDRNRRASMAARGETGAIGVTVGGEKEADGTLIIREIKPDSGAAAAGLHIGDAILRVGDMDMTELTVDEAVAMIRGEPDTFVRLLIAREGEEDREYSVKRSTTIAVETVQAGFLKDDYLPGYQIAYIFIDYFASNSGGMFEELLDEMLEGGAQALIIDLRYNGGGDVAATVQIAGRLLPNGELMRLGLRNDEQIFRIQRGNPIDIPYAILVNGGSASASEILAGAVQDGESGLLIGTRTYGKGSVQSLYDLPTGSGLRVTEGRYYLPSGRCIDGEGIIPDFIVENPIYGEGLAGVSGAPGDVSDEEDRDVQLQTALDLLKEVIDGTETIASLLARQKA